MDIPCYLVGLEKYFSSYFYIQWKELYYTHKNILLFLGGENKYFSSNYGIKICYFLGKKNYYLCVLKNDK